MIHYHGLPITPESTAVTAITGAHAFVSYAHPEQLPIAISVAHSFALDNGAFSAWKKGNAVTDWSGYYLWVAELHRLPNCDFAVIPDDIDGDEVANDRLLEEWPWSDPRGKGKFRGIGAPVWHLHESLERLVRLAHEWPRICIGSSGQYADIGTNKWWERMAEAMNSICDSEGRPVCKLHGLRMLDPEVFSVFPFSSADSTNIARNVNIDSAWRSGTYQPATKGARALVMRDRIECRQSAAVWLPQMIQKSWI